MIKLFVHIAFIIIAAPAFCQVADNAQRDTGAVHSNMIIPGPSGYSNDFDHLFTNAQSKSLDSLLAAFDEATGIQIALVTIDTNMTTAEDFEPFVHRLAGKWGIGQKDKNNGIVVAIANRYRRMRIETGYGIQIILTDQEAQEIIENVFIPQFKGHKLYEGTFVGLQAIINKLQQNKKRNPKMFNN